MLLPIFFVDLNNIRLQLCACSKKSENLEILPNSEDYNSSLLVELKEMANSLSDAGGKAAEERALAKGCQIIQKLQGNSKYPKVVAEHSEFVRLLQSVAKVCNEAKKDNSMFNFELIETFTKNGPPILPQLKLKERQLLQELKNAKKDSELLETGGLVARLCLNVLPEGHPWKSALKELLGDNVHLLPSDLLQFLISKMNSVTIDERIGDKKSENSFKKAAKLTKEQHRPSEAGYRRMRREADQKPFVFISISLVLIVVAFFGGVYYLATHG